MLALVTMLVAAPVPKDPARVEAPTVRHVSTTQRGGHAYLKFEISNWNDAPLHYSGYTSDSFEGGLKAGAIMPVYRLETKQGKEWNARRLGWCGTGRGPVTIPAKGKGTFEVPVPDGLWDEARIGVTWFTGADRKTADVAWGVVASTDATPKEP